MSWKQWLLALLPVLAGGVASLALFATETDFFLVLRFHSTALLMFFGAVFSLIAGAVMIARNRGRSQSRREYERGVLDAQLAAQEAHRRFLARLDHELKNPITAIQTALAAEMSEHPSVNQQVARAQGDRLASLVSGLRALSSLETRPLDFEEVDLANIVREEADAVSEELTTLGVQKAISVDLPTAPWPLPTVAGDPDILALAVRNLIINAAKYSEPGARIEVRGSEEAGFVVVDVADTGWGIAPDELGQVWDELYRGNTGRRVEGSGLGMALVRVITLRHNGDVSIRSQLGRGTSVRIRVPQLGSGSASVSAIG